MQTFHLEVSDNISDKILWLLGSFKNDVKVKRISGDSSSEINSVALSVKKALNEVKESKKTNKQLDSAWNLLDEL